MGMNVGTRVETVNDLIHGHKKGDQGVCTGLFACDSEPYITVKMDSGKDIGATLEANWKKVDNGNME